MEHNYIDQIILISLTNLLKKFQDFKDLIKNKVKF